MVTPRVHHRYSHLSRRRNVRSSRPVPVRRSGHASALASRSVAVVAQEQLLERRRLAGEGPHAGGLERVEGRVQPRRCRPGTATRLPSITRSCTAAGRARPRAASPARRAIDVRVRWRRSARVPDSTQRPGADDADPVAQPLDLGQDVAAQQHGVAVVAESVDVLLEDGLHQRVEARGRLVEHEQLDVARTARRPAPPSAGCPWSSCGPSWSGRARTARSARRARFSSSPPRSRPEQVDRLAAGEVGPQVHVAGHVGEPAVQGGRVGATGRRRAGGPSPPSLRSRPSSTRMVVDLPAPLGPRKPCTSPARDREVEAVEGADVAEGLDQAPDLDRMRHRAHRTFSARRRDLTRW